MEIAALEDVTDERVLSLTRGDISESFDDPLNIVLASVPVLPAELLSDPIVCPPFDRVKAVFGRVPAERNILDLVEAWAEVKTIFPSVETALAMFGHFIKVEHRTSYSDVYR